MEGNAPQEFTVTVIVCLSAVKHGENVTGGGKRKGIKADKCGDWKVKVSYMFFLFSHAFKPWQVCSSSPHPYSQWRWPLSALPRNTQSCLVSLSPFLPTLPPSSLSHAIPPFTTTLLLFLSMVGSLTPLMSQHTVIALNGDNGMPCRRGRCGSVWEALLESARACLPVRSSHL